MTTSAKQRVKLQTQCEIELLGLRNNEKLCYQLVLVKGRILCSNLQSSYPDSIDRLKGRFVQIKQELNQTDQWPINSLNEFKALVRLRPGKNNLNFIYELKKEEIIIERANMEICLIFTENKLLEPLRLGIFLANDSKQVFNIDKESVSKRGERNDLQSAIKRLRFAALLWQLITSESLNSHGLGKKSFRLETDSKSEPIVHIFKSEKNLNEIKSLFNDPIDSNKFKFFDLIHTTIKENPLFMSQSENIRKNMVFACLVLDSDWDPESRQVMVHAALGNGEIPPKLAIFGSHLIHAWPEGQHDFLERLTDIRKLNLDELANDDSPTKLKAFNTGMGSFLHQVGHVFSLKHSGSGIMARDWLLNRVLMSFEAIDERTLRPIRHDEEKRTGWNRFDATILSNHPNIKDSTYLDDPRIWKVDDFDIRFKRISKTEWVELKDEMVLTNLKLIKEKKDLTILYAEGKRFYISLDSKFAKWGSDLNSINKVFHSGKWLLA